MLSRNSTFINTLSNYAVLATLVLGLLLVLPISEDFLTQSKLLVFFVSTLVLGLTFVIYSIQKKTIELVLSPITIPLLVFGGAMAASTFFTNNYPVEALLRFGGVYLLIVLYVLFASTTTTKKLAQWIIPVAGSVGAVLTLFAVTQIFGFGPANVFNSMFGLNIPQDLSFSLAVNSLFALQFLVITAVGMVAESVITKNISKFTAILFPILLCGIAVLGWSLLPGKPGAQAFPNWTASWSIALDTIRAPRAALIGGGPASYSNLYTRFKPTWLNETALWDLSFNQANNLPLTLLSTTGFIGLITWLVLVFQIFKLSRFAQDSQSKVIGIMLLASIAFQMFLPTHIVIFLIQAVLLVALVASMHGSLPVMRFQALTMSMDTQDEAFHAPSKKVSFPIYFTGAVILVLLAFTGYFGFRYYMASVYFFDSAKAAEAQDIVTAYEKQQRAVQLNPYYDLYHRQYAVTNMAIASALSQKTDITDQEKEQVSALIQQSVQEARAAVTLDPIDSQNTSVLAQIYQNLIGTAEQADQFAVQAYIASIENDPTSPGLRVALGGLLASQKQYTQAAGVFNQAVALKRNFPNSYYNLAVTLVQLNDYENAKSAYQALIPLLSDQPDALKKVEEELSAVQKKLDEKAAADAANKERTTSTTGQSQPSTNTGSSTNANSSKAPSLLDSNLNNANTVTDPADDVKLRAGETSTETPPPAPANN